MEETKKVQGNFETQQKIRPKRIITKAEVYDEKRKSRNTGIVIGVFATLIGSLIVKETTGANVTDGVSKVYHAGKDAVKRRFSKSQNLQENQESGEGK